MSKSHLGKKRTDQFSSLTGGKEKRLLNRLKDSRPEQDNDALQETEELIIKIFYNGEFDPGSG